MAKVHNVSRFLFILFIYGEHVALHEGATPLWPLARLDSLMLSTLLPRLLIGVLSKVIHNCLIVYVVFFHDKFFFRAALALLIGRLLHIVKIDLE